MASYNDVREKCGLKRAKTWRKLRQYIPKSLVRKLKKFYDTPDDIEFVIGGALETQVNGSLVGPTFTCIILEQFYRIRVGDRLFFENGGKQSFTSAQLKEIRKSSIARIYCDHVKDLQKIQPKAFELKHLLKVYFC